jgi:hypothetical protein
MHAPQTSHAGAESRAGRDACAASREGVAPGTPCAGSGDAPGADRAAPGGMPWSGRAGGRPRGRAGLGRACYGRGAGRGTTERARRGGLPRGEGAGTRGEAARAGGGPSAPGRGRARRGGLLRAAPGRPRRAGRAPWLGRARGRERGGSAGPRAGRPKTAWVAREGKEEGGRKGRKSAVAGPKERGRDFPFIFFLFSYYLFYI